MGLSLAYVPMGPPGEGSPPEERRAFLVALAEELRGLLPWGCFLLRYDLPEDSQGGEGSVYRRSLRKPPVDIQPPDTVVLDLREGYDSLLVKMHKKTRYNIRLAEKKGVQVKEEGPEALSLWYRLYQATAQRDRIAIHPEAYYKRLFDLVASAPEGELKLLMAYDAEGDPLAGILLLLYGKEATYLYGASSNNKRNLMPTYALQARGIELAIQGGCESYDLFGIPPSSDPGHPMAGLYRFKTGFGGTIRHRPGCWDYPYSHLFYGPYRLAEGLRHYYYKVVKKR